MRRGGASTAIVSSASSARKRTQIVCTVAKCIVPIDHRCPCDTVGLVVKANCVNRCTCETCWPGGLFDALMEHPFWYGDQFWQVLNATYERRKTEPPLFRPLMKCEEWDIVLKLHARGFDGSDLRKNFVNDGRFRFVEKLGITGVEMGASYGQVSCSAREDYLIYRKKGGKFEFSQSMSQSTEAEAIKKAEELALSNPTMQYIVYAPISMSTVNHVKTERLR